MKKTANLILIAAVLIACSIFAFVLSRPKSDSYSNNIEKFQKEGVPTFSVPLFTLPKGELSPLFNFRNVKSPIVLVHFWASWCAPCKQEFPELLTLASKFSSRRLTLVTISEDKNQNESAAFVASLAGKGSKKFPGNFILGWDAGSKIAELYGTEKLPETYIVDSDRRLVSKVVARQKWLSPDFVKFMEALSSRERN